MSGPVRADIIDTGEKDHVRARIVIDAPPSAVFALLADPRRQADFDG
jgi:uncharacterized protein YndB with AHSA1/START domain